MTILITSCDDNLLWYRNHINTIWKVLEDYGDCWKVRDAFGYLNIVYKKHAKIIGKP